MTVAELPCQPEMSRLAEDDGLNASKDTFVGGTGPVAGGGPDQDEESSLPRQKGKGGVLGAAERCMDLLVEYGVEERGIQPLAVEERETLTLWGYLPQFTIWAAFNTNILTFSEGMLGPALFGLDWTASALCIVFFTAASCVPVAYLATNGPKTGMRTMVQARYAVGYVPALVFGLINCVSFVGFLSLTVILGGQCLSLASNSDMSWTVGIIVVAMIALLTSFVGLRALHIVSLASFPIILVLYIVVAGVVGDKLPLVNGDAVAAVADVTASGVLSYGATLIGFTVSYCSLSSDYTTALPPNTPRRLLFPVVFLGLFLPICLVQLFGAACQLVAFSFDDWTAAAEIGTPNLLFEMTGAGGAARFVMVLLCFSVIANTAPTIYSCGLSGQVAIPWLVRVPRYFLAVLVSAIYLPIAIVGSTHFYTVLSNFVGILGYWQGIFVPPLLLEPLVFRRPVGPETYPVEIWNKVGRLPMGLAAVIAGACGIPLIAAGMSQTWWTGWIAQMIPGGDGDVAFEITFAAVAILYVPLRYLERKYTGR